MGPDGVSGLQNGGINARDLGELEDKPAFRTRVEWYSGLAVFKGRAAARLQHIALLHVYNISPTLRSLFNFDL
jgi:hypothetical protein